MAKIIDVRTGASTAFTHTANPAVVIEPLVEAIEECQNIAYVKILLEQFSHRLKEFTLDFQFKAIILLRLQILNTDLSPEIYSHIISFASKKSMEIAKLKATPHT